MLTMGMPHQVACPWIAMQSRKPFNVSSRRSILFLLMFGVAGSAVAENVKKKMLIDMTVDEQLSLVSEMDVLVNREAGKGFFFEQDAGPVHVNVSLDVESNHVVMDLDERLGPESQGAEMEDFLDRLRFSIDEQLSRIDGIVGITYLYGGRSSDFWYPEEVSSIRSSRKKREVEGQEKPPLVVISPGHGFYYHHGYKDWRAQRESVNGILEDDITMPMASKLQWALELGGANARLTRADALGAHQASGLLWSKLSSRYTLEALLPENPEIWHSMPKSTKPLRDRDEDLRSRPLYANFLKADALIHVHTNADGNPKATGVRAIIHPGRENQALAKNILCSMRELIHANESFSDYVVPSDPSVMTNKGENRLAKMPSVIVEVGFHTNPSDAAYLKDVTFQQLAMRGVAKGFRLFMDGKHCEQFAVSDVKQEKPGPWGDLMFSATLMGNPAFPIYIRHGKKGCADRRCRDESPALYSREDVEKYRLMYLCKREDHGAIDFEASAIDFDKVKSEPAFFQVTCGQSRR